MRDFDTVRDALTFGGDDDTHEALAALDRIEEAARRVEKAAHICRNDTPYEKSECPGCWLRAALEEESDGSN